MGYEIDDDPQGGPAQTDADRTKGITEDHRALKNQSSVQPDDYPVKDRKDQSLVDKQPS